MFIMATLLLIWWLRYGLLLLFQGDVSGHNTPFSWWQWHSSCNWPTDPVKQRRHCTSKKAVSVSRYCTTNTGDWYSSPSFTRESGLDFFNSSLVHFYFHKWHAHFQFSNLNEENEDFRMWRWKQVARSQKASSNCLPLLNSQAIL